MHPLVFLMFLCSLFSRQGYAESGKISCSDAPFPAFPCVELPTLSPEPDTAEPLIHKLLAISLTATEPIQSREASKHGPKIIYWPTGKTGEKTNKQNGTGGNAGSVSGTGRKTSPKQPLSGHLQGNGRDTGGKQPYEIPSASKSSGTQLSDDIFIISVGDVEFQIRKDQLLPSNRGQEDAATIKACRVTNTLEYIPLNEIETIMAIPEGGRLSKYGSSPLDYLLTYGTEITRSALKAYYPFSMIIEWGGHLLANFKNPGYPVDLKCEICSEPLLSQQNLTPCEHPTNRHAFHTGCLSEWFRRNQSNMWCPYCGEDMPEPLFMLLSKGLESELHHGVESADTAFVKTLLATKMDVNAKNADGNTPLWLACSRHQYDMVALLLGHNADIHQTGFEGMTPLDAAVITSPRFGYNDTVIRTLFDKGGLVTAQGIGGMHDILDSKLKHDLISRYRVQIIAADIAEKHAASSMKEDENKTPETAAGNNEKGLHCFLCNTDTNISTVNNMPVCSDCLSLQAEQTEFHESVRAPELKRPDISPITDSLFLGNYDLASSRNDLLTHKITSIVVCGASLKQHFPNDFNYYHIPIEDKTEEDISKYFSTTWDFIEGELSQNPESKVLVHCHAGVSRSSSIVIGYLMKKLKLTYDEAFRYVKERRPCIFPNESFVQQLKWYESVLEEDVVKPSTADDSANSVYRRACRKFQ